MAGDAGRQLLAECREQLLAARFRNRLAKDTEKAGVFLFCSDDGLAAACAESSMIALYLSPICIADIRL
jgi:hypothetical protein